jgi:hypothetical protein
MIDSQIVKNIINALIDKGITNPSKLATSIDYDQGNMSKIVNDKLRIPSSLREKLYQKYGILHSYTLTGQGEMFEENKTSTIQNKGIPVYDIDFTAGDVTQFSDFQELVIGYINFSGFRNCIAFEKVKGNSMFPTFTAGDLVGLEPQENINIIEYGQPFAIVTTGKQSLIKIIRKGKDNDNLILRSNNKDFDDIDIHKKEILRLYKAHGPIRDAHY